MRFLSLVGNSFGCSASGERLVSAARDGDIQEAKALLEYNPRLAKYSTFGVRNSPLHYSAAQGHHEVSLILTFKQLGGLNLQIHFDHKLTSLVLFIVSFIDCLTVA